MYRNLKQFAGLASVSVKFGACYVWLSHGCANRAVNFRPVRYNFGRGSLIAVANR